MTTSRIQTAPGFQWSTLVTTLGLGCVPFALGLLIFGIAGPIPALIAGFLFGLIAGMVNALNSKPGTLMIPRDPKPFLLKLGYALSAAGDTTSTWKKAWPGRETLSVTASGSEFMIAAPLWSLKKLEKTFANWKE